MPDFLLSLKGEELKKLIGAPAYIECSSKTQQVSISYSCCCEPLLRCLSRPSLLTVIVFPLGIQNVKAVFDAAIKVVLQPPKQKKRKKRKAQKGCSIL